MLILHENLELLMPRENFPLKKWGFSEIGQKDGDFLFWSTLEPMVTFIGLKNHTYLQEAFYFTHPVPSYSNYFLCCEIDREGNEMGLL